MFKCYSDNFFATKGPQNVCMPDKKAEVINISCKTYTHTLRFYHVILLSKN